MKQGILIGFANSGRKKLINSCSIEKLKDNLILVRNKGFIETSKDVYQGLLQFCKQVRQCHIIFLVIAYGRLDIMKRKLNLLMNHFKSYSDQVNLIITNFERCKNLDDLIEIKNKLATPYNIKDCFAHQCQNKIGFIIDCDLIQTDGYQFFKQLTFSYQQQIIFDPILMNLDTLYDQKILDMLQSLIQKHRQNDIHIEKKDLNQSYDSDQICQQQDSNGQSKFQIKKEMLFIRADNSCLKNIRMQSVIRQDQEQGANNTKITKQINKRNPNKIDFIKRNIENASKPKNFEKKQIPLKK